MTCIVGFVDKKEKTVIMGADSAGVGGMNITIRRDVKIFHNGDFLIGCTSSFRMIQLLQFSFKPPVMNKKDVYEYMCVDFINAVRKCFADGGYLQKETKGDEKGGTFLVAYKNRLFCVSDDFQVAESLDGIDACGCGWSYALGALKVLNKRNGTNKDKVREALEIAEFYSAGVARPFHILTTKK